jgi:hypothetical protein
LFRHQGFGNARHVKQREIHTPFALEADLVPALPVQHLTPLLQYRQIAHDPHLSTGRVGALWPAALRSRVSFLHLLAPSDSVVLSRFYVGMFFLLKVNCCYIGNLGNLQLFAPTVFYLVFANKHSCKL